MITSIGDKNSNRDARFKSAAPEGWPMSLSPLGLASSSCVYCRGIGFHPAGRLEIICGCVYRSVFRVCLSRYYRERHKVSHPVRLDVGVGAHSFTCPGVEYIVDFKNVAMKALPVGVMRTVMQVHFIDGHDYKHSYCLARQLDKTLNMGKFWRSIYRMQELVGRKFVTIQPCRLFPVDEYFTSRGAVVSLLPGKRPKGQRIAALSEPPESWPYPTRQSLREMRMKRAA